MNKILFILGTSFDPRYVKRIDSFQHLNFKTGVAWFERDNGATGKPDYSGLSLSLGKVQSGNYLKRIFRLVPAFLKLRRITNRFTDLYVMSQDMLVPSLFLRKRKWYFEIADIREFENRFCNYLYDSMKKCIYRNVDRIIVTSPKFKDYLSEKYYLPDRKFYILENKLSPGHFPANDEITFSEINPGRFTIGIIGKLRYPNILWFLGAYRKIGADFRIEIWGSGCLVSEIKKYTDGEKVAYMGEYKNPGDLRRIYGRIDLSFIMYDARELNVCLALPNKLYESMYFRRPIIASQHTYLGEIVTKYGIGLTWDQNKMEELVSYLDSKKFASDYNRTRAGFRTIKSGDIFDYESDNLLIS